MKIPIKKSQKNWPNYTISLPQPYKDQKDYLISKGVNISAVVQKAISDIYQELKKIEQNQGGVK